MAPNPIMNLVPVVLIFMVMYLFLIRPQMKQQRAMAQMQGELKKNDEVVTIGGIHGVIVNVKEKTVVLKVDDNTRVEVDRTSMARVVKAG